MTWGKKKKKALWGVCLNDYGHKNDKGKRTSKIHKNQKHYGQKKPKYNSKHER
jgi:hypothetical protein